MFLPGLGVGGTIDRGQHVEHDLVGGVTPAGFPSTGRGAGLPVDTVELASVLDEFTATVTREFSLDDILRQLALAVTRVLRVAGAGVSAPGPDGHLLRTVFASTEPVLQLSGVQESLQSGPCRDAMDSGQVINLADLRDEGAWPEFQDRADSLCLRAVAAVPLTARGRRWGVMDMYRAEPLPFSAAELAAATTLANLALSYLVVAEDRDTALQAQGELADRAMHDELTGLPVRWVFLDHLARALTRLSRAPKHVAVLFLDLDGLKYVNDTYGHAAGDQLIFTGVERILAALRPSDMVARIGGDEFVVLLEDVERPQDAVDVAHRILGSLATPWRYEGHTVRPSASVGVACTPDSRTSGATLIAHADSAMYQAKRSGGGRCELFDPSVYAVNRASAAAQEQLARELRHGLDAGELEVHYQPILRIEDRDGRVQPGSMYAVEALVRWRHPRRGLLAAGIFLDTAERHGFLPEIGAFVMRSACTQLAAWDLEVGAAAPRFLFVNVSPLELLEPDLVQHTTSSLSAAGLEPRRLTVEITETGLLQQSEAAARALQSLLDLGCALAIDDFGTGYSSLSRLIDIPAGTIKVDQEFTHRLSRDASAAAVISAVVTLGQKLRRTVVAEGVEDSTMQQELYQLGIRYLQGFHLAVPMSGAELTEQLRPPPP